MPTIFPTQDDISAAPGSGVGPHVPSSPAPDPVWMTRSVDAPIFEVGSLLDTNKRAGKRAADRLLELAAGNGFLYLADHGVEQDLIDMTYDQAAVFFARPEERKLEFYIGDRAVHRGYVPTSERGLYDDETGPRLYEAFDMGVGVKRTMADRQNPLLGPNRWPDQSGFALTMSRYLRAMQRLSRLMTTGIERSLGVPPLTFARHMRNPVSQLRLLHYLPNEQLSRAPVNMGAHTDYELFTILHSRHAGLQVLDVEDNWVDAPPIEGTYYFNIGDMFEAWTGGIVTATAHRVRNRGEERFSMPFFAATDYDTVVSPIDCGRYAALRRHYDPIPAGDHLLRQLLRDFPYLRRRYEQGRLPILAGVQPVSSDQNPFENRIHQCDAA